MRWRKDGGGHGVSGTRRGPSGERGRHLLPVLKRRGDHCDPRPPVSPHPSGRRESIWAPRYLWRAGPQLSPGFPGAQSLLSQGDRSSSLPSRQVGPDTSRVTPLCPLVPSFLRSFQAVPCVSHLSGLHLSLAFWTPSPVYGGSHLCLSAFLAPSFPSWCPAVCLSSAGRTALEASLACPCSPGASHWGISPNLSTCSLHLSALSPLLLKPSLYLLANPLGCCGSMRAGPLCPEFHPGVRVVPGHVCSPRRMKMK